MFPEQSPRPSRSPPVDTAAQRSRGGCPSARSCRGWSEESRPAPTASWSAVLPLWSAALTSMPRSVRTRASSRLREPADPPRRWRGRHGGTSHEVRRGHAAREPASEPARQDGCAHRVARGCDRSTAARRAQRGVVAGGPLTSRVSERHRTARPVHTQARGGEMPCLHLAGTAGA